MIRSFLLTIFSLASFSLNAQILNIEKSRLEKDTINYFSGNISSSFSLNNRSAGELDPVNFLGFNSRVNLRYKSNHHSYIVISNIDFLSINESPFINTGFNHLRVNWYHQRRFHFETFAQHQYDNFRGLRPRLLAGVGSRIRLINEKLFNLTLGNGLMYEWERWEHPYRELVIHANFLKNSNYLSTRIKLNQYLDFNFIGYYQWGYDTGIEAVRHRISMDANLISKITDRLSFTTSFSLGFEDKPIVPITRTIYNLTNGIQISF